MMNNKKNRFLRSYGLTLLLSYGLFPFFCLAQQPIIDIDENTQNRIMAAEVKACDYTPNFNVDKTSIIKNNKQIPAFGLYQNLWDTLYIRSEKIEIPFFDDKLKIILIQEGNTPFTFPISGNLSQSFIKNKGKQHTGIDFSVSKSEPVVACFDGVVRIAKKYETYGNTVIIRHYNGLETVYASLNQVCVTSNQQVKAGELIGYVGINSKNVLHFEIRFLNEFFNPEKVINFSERKLQSNMLILTPVDFISVPVVMPNPAVKQEETKTEDKIQPLLDIPKTIPVYHTVQTGETIYKICSKYNITETQLRSLNQIKGNNIMIGQKLRIK